MEEQAGINRSMATLGALTALFVGLKLFGAIDWSWPWVLSPILIPLFLIAGFVGALCMVISLSFLIGSR